MHYSDLRPIDSANGLGVATTLFVSGCNFHCEGCFNKEAWDFNYGKEFTKEVEDKFIQYAKNPHVNHISLLGGEIFQQDLGLILHLVRRLRKEVRKPLWIWTGYTWEELLTDDYKLAILIHCDVLTDGRFVNSLKSNNLFFKGSSNQRTIDVQKSLNKGEVILYEPKTT